MERKAPGLSGTHASRSSTRLPRGPCRLSGDCRAPCWTGRSREHPPSPSPHPSSRPSHNPRFLGTAGCEAAQRPFSPRALTAGTAPGHPTSHTPKRPSPKATPRPLPLRQHVAGTSALRGCAVKARQASAAGARAPCPTCALRPPVSRQAAGQEGSAVAGRRGRKARDARQPPGDDSGRAGGGRGARSGRRDRSW